MRFAKIAFALATLVASLHSIATPAADATSYAESDFARVEKIDTHVHLHGTLPVFIKRAEADGFRLLTINVNYSDFPPLQEQLRDSLALKLAYPGRVAFATTFDAAGSEKPEWLPRIEQQIEAALEQGAVGVKVWKDIGMQHRDADGHIVMIDDKRFDPLFTMLEKQKVVVLGHQGEPRNAWLPLEQMTIEGDRQYFSQHPQYHMQAHPEWPSYEQQLTARDRMLHKHPDLRFVGVHLASLEWDVDQVAQFLDRYPHASVDLAARLVHLQLQASKDPQKVRQFFVKYQDRILYGSDLARGRHQKDSEFAKEIHAAWVADWRFLATDAKKLSSSDFSGSFQGLALPRSVLDKIYHGNARRIFAGAWINNG